MSTLLPDWVFSKTLDDSTLIAMSDDLLFTAKQHILSNLGGPVDDTVGQKRVEARAMMDSIAVMINMDEKRQSYILWALVQLEESGLWRYVENEYDTIQELVQATCQREQEKNPTSSASYDWSFISSTLIPTLKAYGFSSIKAIGMLGSDTKLRAAVPKLRSVFKYTAEDQQQAEISSILEMVINPEISTASLRSTMHQHRDLTMLPPESTAFYMTGNNGKGFLTFKVNNSSQRNAIERATRGLLEDESSQFYPRDITSLAREVATTYKKIEGLVTTPYTIEEIQTRAVNGSIGGVIEISLEHLIRWNKEQIDEYLSKKLTNAVLPLKSYNIAETHGNSIYLYVIVQVETLLHLVENT